MTKKTMGCIGNSQATPKAYIFTHNNNRCASFIKAAIVALAVRELISPKVAYRIINMGGLRNA